MRAWILLLLASCASRPAAAPAPAATPVVMPKDVIVDPTTSPEERARIARFYVEARRDLAKAFGGSLVSEEPPVVFCKSAPCVADYAGPTGRSRVLGPHSKAPGATWTSGDRRTILMTRVDEGAKSVLLHEMVHLEMIARLGSARVPEWFHEGLAFTLANRDLCAEPRPRGIDDLRKLDEAWARWADHDFQAKSHDTYCQAFREVDAWIHRRHTEGLLALVAAVKSGTPFYEAYGPMLTQTSDTMATTNTTFDKAALVSNATFDTLTVRGEDDSFARIYGFAHLATGDDPFTISLWVDPQKTAGTLVHVSANDDGTGWCVPFLGFDSSGKLVAQIVHGNEQFAIARSDAPLPIDKWSHVAMTWSPKDRLRLYVNGVETASAATPRYAAAGRGVLLYVTYGSSNVRGAKSCWSGAIAPGGFAGSMRAMTISASQASASDLAELIRTKSR